MVEYVCGWCVDGGVCVWMECVCGGVCVDGVCVCGWSMCGWWSVCVCVCVCEGRGWRELQGRHTENVCDKQYVKHVTR